MNEWIPVSERLPKNDDDVLVTDGEDCAVGFWREDAHAWDSANFGWLENREESPCGIHTVVAWMPLPEPYKRFEFPEGFFQKERPEATCEPLADISEPMQVSEEVLSGKKKLILTTKP